MIRVDIIRVFSMLMLLQLLLHNSVGFQVSNTSLPIANCLAFLVLFGYSQLECQVKTCCLLTHRLAYPSPSCFRSQLPQASRAVLSASTSSSKLFSNLFNALDTGLKYIVEGASPKAQPQPLSAAPAAQATAVPAQPVMPQPGPFRRPQMGEQFANCHIVASSIRFGPSAVSSLITRTFSACCAILSLLFCVTIDPRRLSVIMEAHRLRASSGSVLPFIIADLTVMPHALTFSQDPHPS